MTAAVLFAAQAALHTQIRVHAMDIGYDPAKIEPIYDGVVDAKAHPAARIAPGEWVDAVVAAIRILPFNESPTQLDQAESR